MTYDTTAPRHRQSEERSGGQTSFNTYLRDVIGGRDRLKETISVRIQGFMREEAHAASDWNLEDGGVVREEDASSGVAQGKAHG